MKKRQNSEKSSTTRFVFKNFELMNFRSEKYVKISLKYDLRNSKNELT